MSKIAVIAWTNNPEQLATEVEALRAYGHDVVTAPLMSEPQVPQNSGAIVRENPILRFQVLWFHSILSVNRVLQFQPEAVEVHLPQGPDSWWSKLHQKSSFLRARMPAKSAYMASRLVSAVLRCPVFFSLHSVAPLTREMLDHELELRPQSLLTVGGSESRATWQTELALMVRFLESEPDLHWSIFTVRGNLSPGDWEVLNQKDVRGLAISDRVRVFGDEGPASLARAVMRARSVVLAGVEDEFLIQLVLSQGMGKPLVLSLEQARRYRLNGSEIEIANPDHPEIWVRRAVQRALSVSG